MQSALEYNNADEIEAGEEIPAAEDAGVSEAGDAAPKQEDFAPSFELAFDKKDEPKEQKQIAFEDFLGHDYNESFFVKAGEENKKEATPVEEKHEEPEEEPTSNETEIPVAEPEIVEEEKPKPQDPEETAPYKPLSEHLSKTITIGLNDRIGFEKQLFGGSSEDLNRVLSQLNTFNTFAEAQDFIEDMVRPDYNWDGKDDYVQRFMDIVEKKFS
ncbi:hypothetical protein [Flavobacterium sp. 3HN19-14]|uniref:hypothetical protein n=1 Tax=Flavobacterium sp. 3HN19-14 TaxID=3448133 RepID=UPI003EE1634A